MWAGAAGCRFEGRGGSGSRVQGVWRFWGLFCSCSFHTSGGMRNWSFPTASNPPSPAQLRQEMSWRVPSCSLPALLSCANPPRAPVLLQPQPEGFMLAIHLEKGQGLNLLLPSTAAPTAVLSLEGSRRLKSSPGPSEEPPNPPWSLGACPSCWQRCFIAGHPDLGAVVAEGQG